MKIIESPLYLKSPEIERVVLMKVDFIEEKTTIELNKEEEFMEELKKLRNELKELRKENNRQKRELERIISELGETRKELYRFISGENIR